MKKQSGYEREVNNGKKSHCRRKTLQKNDITNAKLLIKAKAKEIKEQKPCYKDGDGLEKLRKACIRR